ncbi:energy transducer TonB [Sphingomonas parva]|uniref:Energy transducer TonB n=1 Tax=Sphingomonas parva TaxID=2555898 RepID=A0A4Y8ZP90_9SPHN|nr:energy transducer TonB [Sphingomonas parva]TFI57784.1 energy transducer TonB [Sphingomonas parva]
MFKQLILGALSFAAVPAAAKESAPAALTRSGKWVVDYDRDACHLLAQFGTGDDLVAMRLTRYQPGDWFDLSLYGSRLASESPRSEASVDFGLGGAPFETSTVNGKAGTLPLSLISWLRLDGWRPAEPDEVAPSVSPQQEAAVTGVTVKLQGRKPFRLAFGSLAKPLEQLRLCEAELVKSWGYDPAVQAALASPVRPANPPYRWVGPSDYPSGALRDGANGVVQFRLDVETDGKVSGCHVLARTSPDVFADTTCRAITRRAKLEPALGADGKPVRSYYVQKVVWRVE